MSEVIRSMTKCECAVAIPCRLSMHISMQLKLLPSTCVQASKVSAELTHEKEKGSKAALEAAQATLAKNKEAIKGLEEQQASARAATDGLEAEVRKQVLL